MNNGDLDAPYLIKVEWRDGSAWPWFLLLGMHGEWLHLEGADSPDGSEKHEGDSFWVHKSEVQKITDLNG